MYRAKAEGRNTVRFFDPSMQAAADRQIELENDLRDSIHRQHFELYCQPQFDTGGALASGEVLVRWRHGERGLVQQEEFIGLAEASGLINPLGKLVLDEACRVLARTLDLDVVAEGVETREQLGFLVARGCGVLQGYLLARPIPIGEFERRFGGTPD